MAHRISVAAFNDYVPEYSIPACITFYPSGFHHNINTPIIAKGHCVDAAYLSRMHAIDCGPPINVLLKIAVRNNIKRHIVAPVHYERRWKGLYVLLKLSHEMACLLPIGCTSVGLKPAFEMFSNQDIRNHKWLIRR